MPARVLGDYSDPVYLTRIEAAPGEHKECNFTSAEVAAKINQFARLFERHHLAQLILDGVSCLPNRVNSLVHTHTGKKYTRVDIGSSGRYMVDNATGEIFGIKAYGQIHRGHRYGTLDTIASWYWGHYYGQPVEQASPAQRQARGIAFAKIENDFNDVVTSIQQQRANGKTGTVYHVNGEYHVVCDGEITQGIAPGATTICKF